MVYGYALCLIAFNARSITALTNIMSETYSVGTGSVPKYAPNAVNPLINPATTNFFAAFLP